MRGLARAARLLALLLILSVGKSQPLPCDAACTARGNCNTDTGDCICPYGYTGKACEIDALSACRITPDGPAVCHQDVTMNCECWRQCERYHCRDGVCERQLPGPRSQPTLPGRDRGCYTQVGQPPEKQLSNPPDDGDAGFIYFEGWRNGSKQVTSSEDIATAMRFSTWGFDVQTLPLAKCPDACHQRGFCMLPWKAKGAKPYCVCHRGFVGQTCEVEETSWCPLDCSGRGTCIDRFCHCRPPYFGLGCARSRSFPPTSLPSPVKFRIYIYELTAQLAYPMVTELGHAREEVASGGIYTAELQFLDQLLASSVRTEDPSEANLFYIPAFLQSYTGPVFDGNEHMALLLGHIQASYPYWNRTSGRDHFFFALSDRGGCMLTGLAKEAIKVVHFGYHLPDPKLSMMIKVRDGGAAEGYTCYHPQRDVMAVPNDPRFRQWAEASSKESVEDIVKRKRKMLFFAGDIPMHPDVAEMSGNARQIMKNLTQLWQDPDFEFFDSRAPVARPDYETGHRESKFCFTPYGFGWGIRLPQAVMANCIPVIVQEHVFQPYEELLPYESFSIRVTNADLPRLREVLRSVSDAQYHGMMQQLVRYRDAFHWYPSLGGRAFDYTIASLRRRYLNLKSLFY